MEIVKTKEYGGSIHSASISIQDLSWIIQTGDCDVFRRQRNIPCRGEPKPTSGQTSQRPTDKTLFVVPVVYQKSLNVILWQAIIYDPSLLFAMIVRTDKQRAWNTLRDMVFGLCLPGGILT